MALRRRSGAGTALGLERSAGVIGAAGPILALTALYFLLVPLDGLVDSWGIMSGGAAKYVSAAILAVFALHAATGGSLYAPDDAKWLGVFLLVGFSTILWAQWFDLYLLGVLVYSMVLSLAILSLVSTRRLDASLVIWAYVGGCIIATVAALGNPAAAARYYGRISVSATYNPNWFAAFNVVAVGGALYLWGHAKRWARAGLAMAIVLLLVGIVMAQSRTAWVAALIATLAYVLTMIRLDAALWVRQFTVRKRFLMVLAGALLLLATGAAVIARLLQGFGVGLEDLAQLQRLLSGDPYEMTAGRTTIWLNALRGGDWLVGSGIGTFPLEYRMNYGGYMAAHNMYVGMLIETGLLGLLLLLAFLGSLVHGARKLAADSDRAAYLFVVVYLIMAGIGHDAIIYKSYWAAWVLAHLILINSHTRSVA